MRTLLCIALVLTAAVGFSPMPCTHISSSSRISMSIVDDWKDFFSPQERQHRKEEHDKEMAEMEAAQKEILERRRDPTMMQAYHALEEARHQKYDHQHDIQVEEELSQDWTPGSSKPYTSVAPKGHNVLDDWKTFFSKSEAEHRGMQHHLEQLDTADAEQQILERRRDPAKMKDYKAKQELRHKRLDKQHEIERSLEFAEEQVDPKLKEGTDFVGDVSTVVGYCACDDCLAFITHVTLLHALISLIAYEERLQRQQEEASPVSSSARQSKQ